MRGGRFEKVESLNTDPSSGPDSLLRKIARVVADSDKTPICAGVGVAGLVNREDGLLISSPNLPGWVNYPLREKLSDILKCPVVIDNDSNAFALQAIESNLIPPEGLWLIITIGTGIGGTIIHDGAIIYGSGFAGEFGHMTVEASGRKCPCGSRGCWERYAASAALSDYYRIRANENTDRSPEEIAHLASMKNTAALKAFEAFGTWLGIGIASLYRCLSPVGIYLAGGLMGASEFFLEHAEYEFHGRCPCSWNVKVLPSSSDAGAAGAAIMGSSQTG